MRPCDDGPCTGLDCPIHEDCPLCDYRRWIVHVQRAENDTTDIACKDERHALFVASAEPIWPAEVVRVHHGDAMVHEFFFQFEAQERYERITR